MLSLIGGYALGVAFPTMPLGWQLAVLFAVLFWVLTFVIYRWASKKMDAVDRERMSWRKGAVGEVTAANTLKTLSDSYVVVNDVTKKLETSIMSSLAQRGVYVIDVKNWKGTVKADGKGELLVNGHPPGKPAIKNLLGGLMDFQKKIKALADNDFFFAG